MLPGSSFTEVGSGKELLSLVAQEATAQRPLAFDLFVVDEDMGDGISGSEAFSLLQEMRSARAMPANKALFISYTAGAELPSERARLLAAGADLVWTKPLPSKSAMLASLREVLLGEACV